MLIYARIILILIMLSAVISGFISLGMIAAGATSMGGVNLLFSGIIFWLAYTNYVDAGTCAANLD